MQPTPAQIYDQFNRSVPLEIGHDRRLTGLAATRNTTPIPPLNNWSQGMVPSAVMQPSLDDVVTKSMLPYPQSQQLVTTQLVGSVPSMQSTLPERIPLEPKPAPAAPACEGPNGLCYDDVNQQLFNLLTGESKGMGCGGDLAKAYRQSGEIQDGTFNWQFEEEFLCRAGMSAPFVATKDCAMGYSRGGSEKASLKILLLHDALDCRRSWRCLQETLSPFADTIAVDLLGSGESSKPRGLNRAASGGEVAEQFPWSFKVHATYLLKMARYFWPESKPVVVGLGWGAQIAAVMASLDSASLESVVLVNPPGLGGQVHPEIAYAELAQFTVLQSEKALLESVVSFEGRVRNVFVENFQSGLGGRDPCRLGALVTGLKPLLEQYAELDRRMVLVEQLAALASSGQVELPKTPENEGGLAVEKIECPVCVLTSGGDLVYGAAYRNLYPAVYYNAAVQVHYFPVGGHFLPLENPKGVAEIILNFVRSRTGVASLDDAFVGFCGLSSVDGEGLVSGLRDLYGL